MKTYWWLFNNLVRFVGVMFALVGAGMALWSLSLLADPHSMISDGNTFTNDPGPKAMGLILSLIVSGLGILLITARRYRPDLGDSPFTPRKNAPAKDPVYKTKFP